MRKESKHDHIDFNKLLDLIHAVEDRHDNSVIPASDEEMEPIWKMCRISASPGRHKTQVTQEQYWVIENYSRVPNHTVKQKESALSQLGHNYSWLSRRVHEYRMGTLEVENEV